MNHQSTVLENPIWSALISANLTFGTGTDHVRIFDLDIAPFGGLETDTRENFRTLFDMVSADRKVVLFSPKLDLNPNPFKIEVMMPGYQMIFEGQYPEMESEDKLLRLTEKHVPAMRALTQLAQPGPFAERTILFGGYHGIFDGDELVAMGGQRLQTSGYTEISAVCTHPDHCGKGYGAKILLAVIRDILDGGKTAYLHVRADNVRAVDLYKRLGFVIYREMNFYILDKNSMS